MVAENPINRKNGSPGPLAIWALTQNGADLAAGLMEKIGGAKLFLGKSVTVAPSDSTRFDSLFRAVSCEFYKFSAHVFIMAAGIVVRLIAPYVKSKRSDPAVVVLDDGGNFAISLLSGHLGGANALAGHVAMLLDAIPVITTATDVNQAPAIDLLAAEKGLFIENPESIKKISMALLKGEKIRLSDPYGILREQLDGWFTEKDGNHKIHRAEVRVNHFVSNISDDTLLLRPKTLSLGVGCNRNTPIKEILETVKEVFDTFKLSMNSIDSIATIEAKADEKGIIMLADILMARLFFYSREELSSVKVPRPSKVVKKHMGVASVCEAAAILASGKGTLLAAKQKTRNVTVAIAAKPCT